MDGSGSVASNSSTWIWLPSLADLRKAAETACPTGALSLSPYGPNEVTLPGTPLKDRNGALHPTRSKCPKYLGL